jgi:hypothetical protein
MEILEEAKVHRGLYSKKKRMKKNKKEEYVGSHPAARPQRCD